MGFRRRIKESPRVDLTPMIDVVFLLLIFFMISTTFIERPGLTIDLPAAGADTILHKDREINVYLSASGDLYLRQKSVSQEDLVSYLNQIPVAQRAGMTFILMADKEAYHGQVVRLMDIARGAGIKNLAIATDPEQTDGQGQ